MNLCCNIHSRYAPWLIRSFAERMGRVESQDTVIMS